MKILLGTGNKHKIQEMTRIIETYSNEHNCNFEILNLNNFAKIAEPIEDGMTFVENAKIKAKYYYDNFKIPTITDDSGIVVDALGGLPGIYSARYASTDNHNASSADNRKKLLDNLEGVENRDARFECAMVLYNGEKYLTTIGLFEGSILYEEIGQNGFGYDIIFYSRDYECPAGLLFSEQKDAVSHRGKALRQLLDKILQNNL